MGIALPVNLLPRGLESLRVLLRFGFRGGDLFAGLFNRPARGIVTLFHDFQDGTEKQAFQHHQQKENKQDGRDAADE